MGEYVIVIVTVIVIEDCDLSVIVIVIVIEDCDFSVIVIVTCILLSPLTSIKTYLKMVQECTLEVGHSAIYR